MYAGKYFPAENVFTKANNNKHRPTHTYTLTHTYTNIHTPIHTYTHLHIHKHTHTHTYTHTYTKSMLFFPLLFQIPPISEHLSESVEKFSNFKLFQKNSVTIRHNF